MVKTRAPNGSVRFRLLRVNQFISSKPEKFYNNNILIYTKINKLLIMLYAFVIIIRKLLEGPIEFSFRIVFFQIANRGSNIIFCFIYLFISLLYLFLYL